MNAYVWIKKNLQGLISWFFQIHVHGSENEPQDGGYLAIANHISYIDVLVMAVALKRQIRFMAKKEVFKVPLIGRIVKSAGAFPVDRKGSAVAPIKKSIALLESGEVVGMFPQGHRFRNRKFDTTKDEIKGGAAMATYRAGVPVLPMFIATRKDRVLPFRRIDIYVGKPIEYAEFGFEKGGSEEYSRASEVMFDRISELMPEERRSK